MKKAKKILALLLCAVLLVAASVAGTLAYLTDNDTTTNTFTVGKVDIELQEYEVDPQTGKKTETETVVQKLEDLELVPGRTIQKNPFITVASNSESCWLFVKIENNLGNAVTITGMEDWTPVEDHDGYYMYKETVAAGAKIDVFKSVIVATSQTEATLNAIANKNIVITAYAVQAEGVDKTAAWGALGQHYTL